MSPHTLRLSVAVVLLQLGLHRTGMPLGQLVRDAGAHRGLASKGICLTESPHWHRRHRGKNRYRFCNGGLKQSVF